MDSRALYLWHDVYQFRILKRQTYKYEYSRESAYNWLPWDFQFFMTVAGVPSAKYGQSLSHKSALVTSFK